MIELLKSEHRLTRNNLQIIACAGSGKTEFVSTRIAYMVASGIANPENIVAFTFTEKAAKELKFRIRAKIRNLIGHQPDVGDIYVGTIHSFCYELLKEYVSGYRVFDVLDEGKRYSFISSIGYHLNLNELEAWLKLSGQKKPYGSTKQAWVINTFIRAIDITREEMVNPQDVSSSKAFIKAAKKYDELLHKGRFLDFSSMMSLVVRKLETDKHFLNEVRNRFTHIAVDEYQDVNPIQERLINLLVGLNGNLCVVGDDDQSIYQWRGSTVKNILTFKDRYKLVFTHYLPTNYRTTDGIIYLSNQLISRNRGRHPKEMKSSGKNTEKGDICKIDFATQAEEIDFIVKRIKHLIGVKWGGNNGQSRGLAYSDIAIFFRSVKYDGRPYLDALERAGIKYAVSGIGGLFEAPEVDVVFSILAYLGDFKKIWDYYSRVGFVPTLSSIYSDAVKIFILPERKKFSHSLQALKHKLEKKHRISLQNVYAEILNLLGIMNKTFHDDDHEIHLYNLGCLSQAISDYEGTRSYCTFKDIHRFCWFIKNYAQGSYDAGAGDDPTRLINAVQVITLHAAKGLGFPVVFMPYCVEKQKRRNATGFINPDNLDLTRYAGSEEDERRLFYVGMTRAKKFLFITACRDLGPRKRKRKPLRYFSELENTHCLTDSFPDPSKRKRLKSQPDKEEYIFFTSYSELSDYLRCSYDYKMRYIFGFNPIIVQALGYGNQVHNILNLLHKLAQEAGLVPSEEEVSRLLEKHFALRYAAKEQQDTLKKSAELSVMRYIDMWRDDFSLSVKTERSFEMDIENALIAGTIDLLKRENSGNGMLEIIDFKTGNQRNFDDAFSLQVQLYTLAAQEALDLNAQKAFVHFLDADKQHRLEIPTSPGYLEQARKTISNAITGISCRDFQRNPKNLKTCRSCDFDMICPTKS
jgi:DNA helicase-2/ATP-dependent DNA helicase PcrA